MTHPTVNATGTTKQAGKQGRALLVKDLAHLDPLTAKGDANGEAVVVTDEVPAGETWHVEAIYVRSETSGATVRVFVGPSTATIYEVDSTPDGSGDRGEYTGAGLRVPTGQRLRILWESVTQGAECVARVQLTKAVLADLTTQGRG